MTGLHGKGPFDSSLELGGTLYVDVGGETREHWYRLQRRKGISKDWTDKRMRGEPGEENIPPWSEG